jgi:hypothetical protein
MSQPEIYVSTDIETDGPIPGPHSLLSLGSAAFAADGKLVGTHEVNLETLPDAAGHPETMTWWATQPDAWAACRRDPVDPGRAMPAYVAWVESLPGLPVFVGYPAGFDFTFVYWYMIRFAGRSPFSFSALDIKTLAMAELGCGYRQATKRNMPKRWFSKRRHTHKALDDALGQGELCMNILADLRRRRAPYPSPGPGAGPPGGLI